MRTHDDALNYWYGRIDFERRTALPGELKLDRMRHLLRRLGDPHARLRIVHVAGTKGKGSSCAMLASVLQAAGYRVGLFTSPHLHDVSERIQVDGVSISQEESLARLREIQAAEKAMDSGEPATFFEIGTALGFLHFDCRCVEVAIVEVGLGGRFDSTNVVEPRLSLITNISYDHMALLGNTLEQIAFEKAGIIKPGIPVITTSTAPAAIALFERIARERHAPLAIAGRDFPLECDLPLALPGEHQRINAAGVVAAVAILREQGLRIPDRAIRHGLAQTHWPARVEKVGESPLIVLDCAHNVASAKALVETMRNRFPVSGKKYLILAISNDKQLAETLAVLSEYFDLFYCTRYANNPRCTPPEQVAQLIRDRRPDAEVIVYPSAIETLSTVRQRAKPEDAIVITGSVFLAGELRNAAKSAS